MTAVRLRRRLAQPKHQVFIEAFTYRIMGILVAGDLTAVDDCQQAASNVQSREAKSCPVRTKLAGLQLP